MRKRLSPQDRNWLHVIFALLLTLGLKGQTAKAESSDPAIEALDHYSFWQVDTEVRDPRWRMRKWATYLELTPVQTKWLKDSELPLYTICFDGSKALEESRDRYLELLEHLSKEQRERLENTRYVDDPVESLLIAPCVQSYLGLSREQKMQIRQIYLSVPDEIKKRAGVEDVYSAPLAISEEARKWGGQQMLATLDDSQRKRLDHRREAVPPPESRLGPNVRVSAEMFSMPEKVFLDWTRTSNPSGFAENGLKALESLVKSGDAERLGTQTAVGPGEIRTSVKTKIGLLEIEPIVSNDGQFVTVNVGVRAGDSEAVFGTARLDRNSMYYLGSSMRTKDIPTSTAVVVAFVQARIAEPTIGENEGRADKQSEPGAPPK